jgi:signal transduction histidine kinase
MQRELTGRFRHLAMLWALGSVALAFATWVCLRLGIGLATTAFIYLILVVLLSLLDSFVSSAIFSVIAVGCLDLFFTEPLFTFRVSAAEDVVALIAFLITSLAVTGLVPRGRRLGTLETNNDITGRKRAEEALRRAQETFLAEAQQLSHTGSFGWNVSTGEIFWSEECYRIFEHDPGSKATVAMVLDRVHPEDIALVREVIDRAANERQEIDFEHRLLMPNGTVKHIHVVAHPVRNAPSKMHFMGAMMDITSRKKTEIALRDSEQRYRHLFHYMPIALWQLDARGLMELFKELRQEGVADFGAYLDQHPEFLHRAMDSLLVEEVNERTLRMFGVRDVSELAGSVARYWEKSHDTFRRAMEARFRGDSIFEEETKIVAPGGKVIDVLFTAARPGPIGDRGISLVGLIDITERIRAQEMLAQVQAEFARAARISVLGELAASIAHEINQPLAAIRTNGETALRWLNRPEPNLPKACELMQRIVDDALRGADIIARMRAMAAGRTPQQTPLKLRDVIAEALVFLRHELQANGVTASLDLAPELPPVIGDRIQLQQVVVNLTINAVQAMANSEATRRRILIRTILSDPETVCCVIEDSGPGIDSGHLPHLFDSFFTTKDAGMGMGLPISRSIIEAHGGRIRADNASSLGGARFSFALPVEAVPTA